MFKNESDFKKIVNRLDIDIQPSDAHRENLYRQMLSIFDEMQKRSTRIDGWQILGRTIMKNPISKLAAAAVIIIAILIGIHHFGGSIDGTSVAWADVVRRAEQIDFVHVYILRFEDGLLKERGEGWYNHGKIVSFFGRNFIYDDGRTQLEFDKNKNLISEHPSPFSKGRTIWNLAGLLTEDNEQFSQQLPERMGDDFLIYVLDAPKHQQDWIESLSVTVGRSSLLPIQIKCHHREQPGAFADYDLFVFDYEEPQRPSEFFEPPSVGEPPHGRGEIVLYGEETMIDIHNAPGIKTAVVRLFDMSPDDNGEPTFSLDVAFIIEEGYRSTTNDFIRLKLNEGRKCGLGADNWPDGKYRNIAFTPLLKPTDREDTYIVEISCWLRTE